MLLHTQHPFPTPDTSARGLGQAKSHLQLVESQEHVAAGGGSSLCLPVPCHSCWEKDRVSGSSLRRAKTRQPPLASLYPFLQELLCSPSELSDPQTAPSP